MGDMGDLFNAMREAKRRLRRQFGRPCPQCNVREPKRTPTILLPSQRRKVDGYRDPRPRLTEEQRRSVWNS